MMMYSSNMVKGSPCVNTAFHIEPFVAHRLLYCYIIILNTKQMPHVFLFKREEWAAALPSFLVDDGCIVFAPPTWFNPILDKN